MFEVIEREGIRVLTTNQLAEVYGTDAKIITNNFQRNKSRFQHGKDYFMLKGDDLKQYKGSHQNDATLKFVSVLYLWTETGAFLLAKSLNSETSWKAYRAMVTDYFKVTKQVNQQQTMPALPVDEQRYLALETRVQEIEEILRGVTLHSGEQLRVQRAVGERVYSMSVKQVERNQLFRAIYHDLKVRFAVGSYRDIKQHELQEALVFISNWGRGIYHESIN